MKRCRTAVFLSVLALLGLSAFALPAFCASVIRDGDSGTIGACLSLPDGTKVSLPGEQIVWRGRSGKSFAIKEYFERPSSRPRLVVVSTRSLSVEDTWTVDVVGTLSTMSGTSKNGSAIRQRVLIVTPSDVLVYCSPKGRPMMFPPAKHLGMEWPNKRSLAELSGTSTIQSASISTMDAGSFPMMDDSPDSEPTPPATGSRDSLKCLPDGAPVSVNGAIVSASFSNYGFFYVEKSDRSFGIWVSAQDYVSEGQLLDITGKMGTGGGERAVIANQGGVTVVDYNTYPRPDELGLPNKALGGGAVGLYTLPVADSAGPNNTGLLVRAWGKVTYVDTTNCIFYINDGSNVTADLGHVGIKVYDMTYDTLPTVDSYATLSGVSAAEWPEGAEASIRVIWKIAPVTPSIQAGSGTISGTITATGADGKTVKIYCASASTTTTFSGNTANYSLSVPYGSHAVTASVIGYKTTTQLATVNSGTPVDLDFTLSEIPKIIDIVSDFNILPHDGTSTTDVHLIVRDAEGRRYPYESITVSVDKGTITSAVPTMTDAVGEASFTVQSSTSAETGLIRVTNGSITGNYLLYYVNPDEPIIWPETIIDGDTVSGEIELKLYTIDQDAAAPVDGSANAMFETNMFNLRGYSVEVDGQDYAGGMPEPDGDEESDILVPYPMVSAAIRTYEFSNGNHTVRFKIEDSAGNTFYSMTYSLVFDNEVSSVAMQGSDANLPDEIDLLNSGNLTISANLKSSTDWRVVAYDFIPNDPSGNPYNNEYEIATGTGTTISCNWDGKLYPAQGTNQPDLAYVVIQTSLSGMSAAGNGVGKWIGVKVVPDSSVKVLCFAGKPTQKKITEDYLYEWPARINTLYRYAKSHGWAAKKLGPTQATWQRVSGIIDNGVCRIVHGCCHGNYTAWPTLSGGSENMTCLYLNDGFVTSKPTAVHPSGRDVYGLGLQNTDQLLFVFFDSCFSGRIGGNIANPYSTAPQVANNARNDMAQVLGMYHGYGDIAKVYMGWHGYSRGDWDWANFVSNDVNSPKGIFGLWCASTGTILSYVVGHYPTGTATPRITKQPGAPAYWDRIQQNLRCFGIGLMGDNDGYKERTFTVIP